MNNRVLILTIVVLALLLLWFGSAIVRLENQNYAMRVGMCGAHDPIDIQNVLDRTRCLETVETRTSPLWHLYYALTYTVSSSNSSSVPKQREDGLLEEKVIRPGESYVVEDYGDLGESQHPSLVCRYSFRGTERTRVYWYSPNDVLGKSYCPDTFTQE